MMIGVLSLMSVTVIDTLVMCINAGIPRSIDITVSSYLSSVSRSSVVAVLMCPSGVASNAS